MPENTSAIMTLRQQCAIYREIGGDDSQYLLLKLKDAEDICKEFDAVMRAATETIKKVRMSMEFVDGKRR